MTIAVVTDTAESQVATRRIRDGADESELIAGIAESHAVVTGGNRRANPAMRLPGIRSSLDGAWSVLQSAGIGPSRGAEWLLDNAYLIASAIELVRETLRPGFVRWLPVLTTGEDAGERRVEALARRLVEVLGGYVDVVRLTSLLRHYQKTTLLTTAELWALPALLRLVVLERLAHEASLLTAAVSSGERPLPPDVADGLRIGPLVEDLRAFATHNWSDFFEAVSPVESVLRRDPAGAHSAMDFETRDRYRKVVEELARYSQRPETDVAETTVSLAARASADRPAERHTGYYLIDRGRPALEAEVGFRAPFALRTRRIAARMAPGFYAATIAILTGVLTLVAAWPAVGAGVAMAVVAILAAVLPASSVAVSAANWLVTRMVRPQPLPKLRIEGGIPAEHATMVVVPALLTNAHEIDQLIGQLERNYHANARSGIRFALLSDFTDSPYEHMPDDDALVKRAVDGIRELNRRCCQGSRGMGSPVESGVIDRNASTGTAERPAESVAAGPQRVVSGDGLGAERDGLGTERNGLGPERDGLGAERNGLGTEHGGLGAERDGLGTEHGGPGSERDGMGAERAGAVAEHGGPSSERGDPDTERAGAGAESLREMAEDPEGPFLLLHRPRLWNAAEACWMGWERKRGKLSEFNRLVAGEPAALRVLAGNPAALHGIRYAITLDADTALPPDSARRLIGTAAHPLNRPVFSTDDSVVRGYTILQPRIELISGDVKTSAFARILEGDRGLDLYSRAVSDVYQDLFGEGSYAGKGLYDIAAFERSLKGRIPENSLLSHDLFEGAHGRAALVSDIAVFEDYPQHVLSYMRRVHRWIRGDWQILPWLGRWVPGTNGRVRNRLSVLNRWKIADNLRRSLVEPALLLFVVAGWLMLPGSAIWWTVLAVLVPGSSFVLGTLSAMRGRIRQPGQRVNLPAAASAAYSELGRWGLALVLLPWRAFVATDAIVRTLVRLRTRRHLLEWTTAASVARSFDAAGQAAVWRRTPAAPVFAVVMTVVIAVSRPGSLAAASPLLTAWLVSPFIAWWVSRPGVTVRRPLSYAEAREARILARRTWLFFETILGPEDHWLPVDHVQEEPHPHAARRTSPTNVGLSSTAVLAAWDLGYLPASRVAAILANQFDSLDRLERYRGHFLNWYETQGLTSLRPRYVSTVDSGNMASALIVVARGCEAILDERLPRSAELAGLRDNILLLRDAIRQPAIQSLPGSATLIDAVDATLRALPKERTRDPDAWRVVATVADTHSPKLQTLAADLLEAATASLDPGEVGRLRATLGIVRQHATLWRQERQELLPWTVLDEAPPAALLLAGESLTSWHALRSALPSHTTLRNIPGIARTGLARLEDLTASLGSVQDDSGAAEWLTTFSVRLTNAAERAESLIDELTAISDRADTFVDAMDFGFLYDPDQHLFRIGFDVDAGRPDRSYYDLLASEARLASLIAIATGAVPAEHWLHLGRPFARAGRDAVMLSWGGTMFEYLMPSLFLQNPESTLLSFACSAAVREQRRYGLQNDLPWGVSESAYHHVDRHGTYQYRAFGVPSLALKREPVERHVVAPYASALAVSTHANEVLDNMRVMTGLGGMGRYGMYEAIDFGRADDGFMREGRIVRSYMAHHQAMILLALDNALVSDVMVQRFHSDARVAAAEHLVLERLPGQARLEPAAITVTPAHGRQAVAPDAGLRPAVPALERPQVHVLSNGRFSTLINDRGSGNMRWLGNALTRWRADPVIDSFGPWLYLQDRDSGVTWSPTTGPIEGMPSEYEVLRAPHMVEFRRVESQIRSRLTIVVPSTGDVDIRQLRLTNEGSKPRRISVTTYGEVVLGSQSEDVRHPAFGKLFVESRYDADARALVFERRPRDGSQGIGLAHAVRTDPGRTKIAGYETDRMRFIGRTGSAARPAGLESGPGGLSGTVGATLDPIFAISVDVRLAPREETVITILTAAGSTGSAALSQIEAFRSPARVEWATREAAERKSAALAAMGLSRDDADLAQGILSALVYPYHGLRATASPIEASHARQNELWGLGISGDLPVIAVTASSESKAELKTVLRIHAFLSQQQVRADLLVLPGTSGGGGYAEPLGGWLRTAVEQIHGPDAWHQTGGVFHLPSGRSAPTTTRTIEASAAVLLDADRGDVRAQIEEGTRHMVVRLPAFVPVPSAPIESLETAPLPVSSGLQYDNGRGGFTSDGREYVIRVEAGESTPAPWINVVAQPQFGFVVTEGGGGFTWSQDSGRHRLTPWRNDPVSDAPGEVVYLRDEETGETWSATPRPKPAATQHEVRHGAGYTTFSSHSHGLEQRLDLFVPVGGGLKIVRLTVKNTWPRQRRLTATYYAEWVLGQSRDISAPHIVTEFAAQSNAILAQQRFSGEFAGRVAFVAASERLHGQTGDRLEFLGSGGLSDPAGLRRIGLGESFGSGYDPCGAVQVHLDLQAGGERSIHFLIGEASSREAAGESIAQYSTVESVESALETVREFWDERLGRIEVHTPEPSMDLLLNRWLPYQALACRLWAKSALYQSSGAYGFRDQLQDSLTFLMTDPAVTRSHIVEACGRQFAEGDVLHWWHPGTTTGMRTRCSDDLLWLPFVTAAYVEATGDSTILHESAAFLDAPALGVGERERYDTYGTASAEHSVYEHCLRAISRGDTRGEHGLPLMGANDWNDGFDQVGDKGRGESVWLGWFLYSTLSGFAILCEAVEGAEAAAAMQSHAEDYRNALEASAWDGGWYRRAYYDDGSPLGSASNDEAKIDSLSQSWSVLSGAAPSERATTAMQAVRKHLLDEANGILRLLTPPFDRGAQQPGYIKAYPPGIRENGAQYTHAAIWAAWAFAELEHGPTAESLFRLLNPILHSSTEEDMRKYRVEPYVVAADIYSESPHTGRGGWTWYTGSAGWLYRYGIERVLGMKLRGRTLYIDPRIPEDWKEYSITYRRGGAEYRIHVENPGGQYDGVEEVLVDGVAADGIGIPIEDTGQHDVTVRLGRATASAPWSPTLW